MSVAVSQLPSYKYKSWKEESNLKNARFLESNIIFGHNGAGKSSLAVGIAKEYIKANGSDTIRYFGSKYVKDTLLLEDESGIRGVVSNFSKKDVDIEKKIKANQKKIDELKVKIEKQSGISQDLIDATESIVKDIVKRRKDKNTKINNKPENKSLPEKIALWEKDFNDSHKAFPDEDYNSITGNADFSAESEQINLLQLPQKINYNDDDYSEITNIFETKYKDVDVPEPEIVTWLESGLHIHKEKEHCEFCGSSIDIGKIKKQVDSFLNDEQHKARTKLEAQKSTLLEACEIGQALIDNEETYRQVLGLSEDELDLGSLASQVDTIKTFTERSIDQKLGNMGDELTLDSDDVVIAIKHINTLVDDLEEAKDQSAKAIIKKINKLETLVKGAIGLEIKNSDSIVDNLTKISESESKLSQLKGDRDKLVSANEKLSEQKSDLADFAEYLNPLLKELGMNFKLAPSGKVFVLRHTDGGPELKLDDISDGERNLLALIYFYFEMLNGDSEKVKESIKLIIIDDPISSLDDNNKFYITELVRSILDINTAQVIVLTHSWDDFCNLAYGRSEDAVSLFEIRKSNSISNIDTLSSKKLAKPYKMLYQEVDIFRQKNVEHVSDADALHMPNTMRRVIEEYAKFRVDVDFATAAKSGDISKALFGVEISTLSGTKKQKLKQLLDICNILSHKANQPKNPTEIHESAKFLIRSIEENDKFHHLKMRGD